MAAPPGIWRLSGPLRQLRAKQPVASELQRQLSQRWICRSCRVPEASHDGKLSRRALLHQRNGPATPRTYQQNALRTFSTTSRRLENQPNDQPKASELPSGEEKERSNASKRFTSLMDNMQTNILSASQRLNDLTGYSGIEKLKRAIERQERRVEATHQARADAKAAYAAAIRERSSTQREVNDLLQRKHAWTPADLDRYTGLYRSDHANEEAEEGARAALAAAERDAEEAAARLGSSILARYHEEQIWSDKIRRMSTWGTWGLMGVNVLLFVVFQVAVEPWRRKRLVTGFEEKVMEALEREGLGNGKKEGELAQELVAPGPVAAVSEAVSAEVQTAAGAVSVEPASLEVEIPLSGEGGIAQRLGLRSGIDGAKRKIHDLFSETQVTVRKVDLTAKALEGAFVGAMLTSIVAAAIRGR